MNILIEGGNLNGIKEGTRNIAIAYAEKFKEKGHNVVIFTKQIDRVKKEGHKKFEIRDGIKYYRWFNYADKLYRIVEKKEGFYRKIYNFLRIISYWQFYFAYRKVMKKENIDIVQIFVKGLRPNLHYKFLKFFNRKPVILTLLGDPSFNKIRYNPKKAFEELDLVIVTSETIYRHLNKSGLKNIKNLPYGIDTKKFSPKKKDNKGIKRIYCSRYYDKINELITALGKLSKKKNFNLVFEEKSKKDLIKNGFNDIYLKKISKRIEYIGYLDNINEFFRKVDIVVDLHIQGRFLTCASPPAKILEAMSSGAIVVSTDIPEIREIIKDDKTGFLVRKNSSEEIYKKLNEALSTRKDIGKNARISVLKRFDIDQSIKEYEKIYASLIKK